MGFDKKKELSKSLFDMAAKKYAKDSEVPKEEPRPQEIKTETPVEDDSSINLFKKAKRLHEEIALRVDNLLRFHDIGVQKFYHFFSDPKNFTKEEWKGLDEERALNTTRIQELCHQLPSGGEEYLKVYLQSIKKTKEVVQAQEKALSAGKETKEGREPIKKKKIIPKHQWLNMH